MGGFFGAVSTDDCVQEVFFGTDYHCHLGTRRGGMAVLDGGSFTRAIHDISNAQFRSKFDADLSRMKGKAAIGVISDYEDQPLIIGSHLGTYALVTVGVVRNADELAKKAFSLRNTHFSEMSGNEINPTEIIATLINQGSTYHEGIAIAQEAIEGSCSLLLLSKDGIYAARDKWGRTPVVIGRKEGCFCAAMEDCAFPNLGYERERELGPGEIALVTAEGCRTLKPAGKEMRICTFLWVYYGFPASNYEGVNVEDSRYRCGAAMARRDLAVDGGPLADLVAGIPDSGVAHALGYAQEARITYKRPFVKYTPTWARSFMPQNQAVRDQVARMKLIPIQALVDGKRLLFCDDSVVRGTQLRDTFKRIYRYGAKEIHLRPACPPLLFGCKYLNFSRSRSEMDLVTRRVIAGLEGSVPEDLSRYLDPSRTEYKAMVDGIGVGMGVTTLRYQRLDDMIAAIGLPAESLCTYCWTGREGGCAGASR